MPGIDPSVVAALEAAVTADPANAALRVHLAGVLVDAAEPARALEHCRAVLAAKPDDLDALAVAERAARGVGDAALVASYARLRHALGGSTAPPVPNGRPAPATDQRDLAFEAELDAFFRNEAEHEDAGVDDVDVHTSTVRLADVGGMTSVKDAINRSFLEPMRNPELRRLYGKSLRGGLLLYGPPGCGKTFLAQAIAGELAAQFYAVGLNEVLDMYLGQSERNLHDVFERARRNRPCVLFLDEVDALGQKRSNLTRSAGRNVVVQLLSELDGITSDNDGIFVLGATNQPWDIDPALRRPGRFDRTVLVLPPDRDARAHIFATHLRDRPVSGVDVKALAKRTEGFSGADIRLVCETAAELAMEDSIRTGHVRTIGARDLDEALRSVVASTHAWFDVARNFVTFANQAGEYDDLYEYMRQRKLA